ncbi:MAG TPA: bifunctional (p)ppGpp synthetase/guanosine-3',5'-bis(diphosphate) 3'-pyrophosphohydrolase [Alphaproteobacteria bacterium]
MIRQYQLVETVKAYDPDADEDLLNRAYVYAMKMHGSQKRANGDPYFSHPLEVAGILTDLKLDDSTIATALLHDTLEDTAATYAEIKQLFGEDVAKMVDGVTKLSKIELQSSENAQAENFRKLILAMSEDIRVLLVKLADRLHNMRTLHFIPKPEKRQRIAAETMEIYAPLAERVGLKKIQDELQDLSFRELHGEARDSIVKRLAYLREDGSNLIEDIIQELQDKLNKASLKVVVSGREKSKYSIWRKMQQKNVAFEQLSDIMAFRVMTENIADCYQVLGILHSAYQVVPGKFKDYISIPKQNGYQSLHTTLIGPQRQRIEVQIRTAEMHKIAELGVAAHWGYKQKNSMADGKQYRWVRELLDILESAQKPDEFLEHTKLELFQERVFCFTPKGDLIELPKGATLVDFAYAVHSKVGDTCVGAKINGRIAPLTTELNNGDQIEIVTSKSQTPSPTWERFVVTGKARAHIRRFVRQQQRDEYAALGKAILQKVFRQEGYEFNDKAVRNVLSQFKHDDVEDLYATLGNGSLTAKDVFAAIFPAHKSKADEGPKTIEDIINKPVGDNKKKKDKPIVIRGLIPGMAIHYARCCHPLPGDRIVGIISTGKGVTIHTIDCDTLESFSDQPERWLDVSWEDGSGGKSSEVMTGRLSLTVQNGTGSLGALSTIIGKNGGNITNLKFTTRSVDFYEMFIDVQVKDARHLNDIVAALRATPIIASVDRARNG